MTKTYRLGKTIWTNKDTEADWGFRWNGRYENESVLQRWGAVLVEEEGYFHHKKGCLYKDDPKHEHVHIVPRDCSVPVEEEEECQICRGLDCVYGGIPCPCQKKAKEEEIEELGTIPESDVFAIAQLWKKTEELVKAVNQLRKTVKEIQEGM